jgi:hypothetical protein
LARQRLEQIGHSLSLHEVAQKQDAQLTTRRTRLPRKCCARHTIIENHHLAGVHSEFLNDKASPKVSEDNAAIGAAEDRAHQFSEWFWQSCMVLK